MERHPKTGAYYIAVIPENAGAFVDIHSCYSYVSRERPWLLVIPPKDFRQTLARMRDERSLFVHWAPGGLTPQDLPTDRKALVFPVYSEAFDLDRNMILPDHLRDLDRFTALAPLFDGFFAHTPWMAEQLSDVTGIQGFPLPVGWHPSMGGPGWTCLKTLPAIFAGSIVARREQLIPLLEQKIPLTVSRGVFGSNLIQRMNQAVASLYVAHSNVRSFSTWRIWQTLCSSAALVTEPGDWWPMSSEMCIPIPRITETNVDEISRIIAALPHSVALQTARALHESLRHFTAKACIDQYVVTPTQGFFP